MNWKIHRGDARYNLHLADGMKTMITDPIWPNCQRVFDCDDPYKLLSETIDALPKSVERIVIVLGCDSDPRFLTAVPDRFPYLKNCFLEFCQPTYKGRNLYTHLSAYVFGTWPKPRPGHNIIPSKVISTEVSKRLEWHPTPMRLKHCKWLVNWFGEGGVIDPFSGSGTIGVACKELLVPFIGFEINEEYCRKANERIDATDQPWC